MSAEPQKILLIEDSPGDARLIREMLGRRKDFTFDLECVDCLGAGLGRLAKGGVETVILDLGLPDSQGLDTLARVCGRASRLPIIVLTGLEDEALGVKAVQKGAQDYLVKGQVDHNLLVRSLRYASERKLMEEKLKEYSEGLEKMLDLRTMELRNAQEQSIRREKLAVLGQLSGEVGHELRNPLGAIKNAAYFLNLALKKPAPEVKEALEILDKEVGTCERIISSLLDFAVPRPTTRRQVDINRLVEEVLSRNSIPQNVEVVSQLDKGLPTILADPGQLAQVLRNIITNAIQAMPRGGHLVVRSQAPNPGWVSMSISDTGLGIPHETLETLFEPLFTTKPRRIGLGLAVTKSIVDKHGGTIEAQSPSTESIQDDTERCGKDTMARGTTFTVTLPVNGREPE